MNGQQLYTDVGSILSTRRARAPNDSRNTVEKQGVESAKVQTSKTEAINQTHFQNLVGVSRKKLIHIKSVFPFSFFTDEISIEPTQVNVLKKYFFATVHLQTIPIKNVADVFLDTSLFFATLRIVDSSYIENSIQVEYLHKNQACQARRIIQGLVIANKEGIDISKLSAGNLLQNVEELGNAKGIDLFN